MKYISYRQIPIHIVEVYAKKNELNIETEENIREVRLAIFKEQDSVRPTQIGMRGDLSKAFGDNYILPEKSIGSLTLDPKQLAFITSVITSEFYRPLLIKTLLSSDQVTDLITTVALKCAECLPKYEKVYRKNVMRWAIDDFLGNHNIKL